MAGSDSEEGCLQKLPPPPRDGVLPAVACLEDVFEQEIMSQCMKVQDQVTRDALSLVVDLVKQVRRALTKKIETESSRHRYLVAKLEEDVLLRAPEAAEEAAGAGARRWASGAPAPHRSGGSLRGGGLGGAGGRADAGDDDAEDSSDGAPPGPRAARPLAGGATSKPIGPLATKPLGKAPEGDGPKPLPPNPLRGGGAVSNMSMPAPDGDGFKRFNRPGALGPRATPRGGAGRGPATAAAAPVGGGERMGGLARQANGPPGAGSDAMVRQGTGSLNGDSDGGEVPKKASTPALGARQVPGRQSAKPAGGAESGGGLAGGGGGSGAGLLRPGGARGARPSGR